MTPCRQAASPSCGERFRRGWIAGLALVAVAALVALGETWLGEATRPATTAVSPDTRIAKGTGTRGEGAGHPTEPDGDPVVAERSRLDAGAGTRWLQVVDAATGRPVPHATVRFGRESSWEHLSPEEYAAAQTAYFNDLEAYLTRYGQVATADAGGWLVRAEAPGWPRVARAGARYGEASNREATRIDVSEDVALAVRVLDASGAPAAGVGVWLSYDHSAGKLPGARPEVVATTDIRGEATLPHVQTVAARVRVAGRSHLVLGTDAAGARSAGTGLHIEIPHWPPQPVVLHLPACRDLVVALRGPRDEPVRPTWSVGVSAVLQVGTPPGAGTAYAEITGDGVRFPRVPLGWPLAVRADLTGLAGEQTLAPLAAGDGPHRVTLRLRSDEAAYYLRALAADRSPLRDRVFSVRGSTLAQDARACSDADGRVRLLAWPADDEPREELLATLCLLDIEHEPSGFERYARRGKLQAVVRLPRAAAGETIDLDDVVLDGGRLLGRGEVVGAAGQSVFASDWERFDIEDRTRVELHTGEEGHDSWHELSGAVVHVEPDATFAVWGTTAARRLRLRDGRSKHAPFAPVEFMTGSGDLRLQLAVCGEIGIDAVAAARDELGFALEPLGAFWPVHDGRSLAPARSNNQQFSSGMPGHDVHLLRDLWPGAYRLTVRVTGLAEPLAVAERVEVHAGAPTRPWQDAPLDPSRLATRTEIELQDEQGGPLRGGRAALWLRAPDAYATPLQSRWDAVWIPHSVTEGVVDATGHALARWAPGTASLRLRAGGRARAQVPADARAARLAVAPSHPLWSWRDVPGLDARLRTDLAPGTTWFDCRAPGPWMLRVIDADAAVHELEVWIGAGQQPTEVALPDNDAPPDATRRR